MGKKLDQTNAKAILPIFDLSDNPAERTLRDDLAKLKKLGLVETTGKGPGAVWHLAQKNEADSDE